MAPTPQHPTTAASSARDERLPGTFPESSFLLAEETTSDTVQIMPLPRSGGSSTLKEVEEVEESDEGEREGVDRLREGSTLPIDKQRAADLYRTFLHSTSDSLSLAQLAQRLAAKLNFNQSEIVDQGVSPRNRTP